MMSTVPGTVPPTREVLAAALLATLGSLGLVGPLMFDGLMASGLIGFSSHGGGGVGPAFVDRLIAHLPAMPVICVAAIAAAFGLYRRAPWGRRLALVVGGALIAAPLALVLRTVLVTEPEFGDEMRVAGGLADLLLFQVFLVVRGALVPAVLVPVLGALVVWGVSTRPGQRPEAEDDPRRAAGTPETSGTPSARRPRVAMVTLAILAVLALAPYLAWVAAARLGPPTPELSAPALPGTASAPSGWDFGIGIIIAIPTAIAAGLAFVAGRAIWSRAAYGPYVAPAAAAIAGLWSTSWLFIVGIQLASRGESEQAAANVAGVLLVALAGLSVLSFFPVTIGVLRRRAWFRERGELGAASRPRRRQAGAVLGIGTALLLTPVGIGAAAWVTNPPGVPLFYNDILVDGRAYRYVAPIDADTTSLVAAGTVSAWTEDLDVTATDVFAVPGTPADRAIVVVGGPDGTPWRLGLFVPSNDVSEGIPTDLCRLIPIEDAIVDVETCGPPYEVSLGSVRYEQISEPSAFTITADDLAPAGATVTTTSEFVDPRIGLAAMAIQDVPTTDAIALLVGRRVVLYKQSGRYGPGELCRFSPAAVANPLPDFDKEDLGIDESPPSGCGFPYVVWLNSTSYPLEQRDQELFDVPVAALTRLGPALAEMPELGPDHPNGRQPFPPTVDPTAYAIEGVDPHHAIAFIVGERVVVMRPKEFGMSIPPGLCPYARQVVIDELEAQGEGPLGC